MNSTTDCNMCKSSGIKRLTQLSLLTSMALIIFIIELRLPNLLPIPGVKAGLANIITVFAVYRFRKSEIAMIVIVRIFLGAVYYRYYFLLWREYNNFHQKIVTCNVLSAVL